MGRNIIHKCHVCEGLIERGGGEHVPPQSTGNSGQLTAYYIKIIDNASKIESNADISYQNGFKIDSLCTNCDNKFGYEYVLSYKDFIDKISLNHILYDEYGRNIVYLNHINPHNIVRQIYSMFLSCNSYNPSGDMKLLKDFVKNPNSDVPKIYPNILLYKNCSNIIKINPFGAVSSPNFRGYVTGSEISFPPLGIIITYQKPDIFRYMTDITEWITYKSDEAITTELYLPQLMVDDSINIPFNFYDIVNPKNPCNFFYKNGSMYMLHVPKYSETPDKLIPMQSGVLIHKGKPDNIARRIKQQNMYDNTAVIGLDSKIIKPPKDGDMETGIMLQKMFSESLKNNKRIKSI